MFRSFFPFRPSEFGLRIAEEVGAPPSNPFYNAATKPGTPPQIDIQQAEGSILFTYTPSESYPAVADTIAIMAWKSNSTDPIIWSEETADTSVMWLDDGASRVGVAWDRVASTPVTIKATWNRSANRMALTVDGKINNGIHTQDFPADVLPGPAVELLLGEHDTYTNAPGTFTNIWVTNVET